MGLTATTREYGHENAGLVEPNSTSGGAEVRVRSGELGGAEGTVICARGNNRLLIRLRGFRDVYLEIDARAVEILRAPS